jgi:hypothetical protein
MAIDRRTSVARALELSFEALMTAIGLETCGVGRAVVRSLDGTRT